MSKANTQDQKSESRYANEDLLLNIGFKRIGASSVFKKGSGTYILSPGVSRGQNDKYWFDVRDANVKKMEGGKTAWVMLRIVPSSFSIFPMTHVLKRLNSSTQGIRKNSGMVCGFGCAIDQHARKIHISVNSGSMPGFSADLLDRDGARMELNEKLSKA